MLFLSPRQKAYFGSFKAFKFGLYGKIYKAKKLPLIYFVKRLGKESKCAFSFFRFSLLHFLSYCFFLFVYFFKPHWNYLCAWMVVRVVVFCFSFLTISQKSHRFQVLNSCVFFQL